MNPIDEFLLNYTSKSTIRTYRFYINDYFRRIKADPKTYFIIERDYENDIREYWRGISNQAPKSIFTGLTAVRVFLSENNIELPNKLWRNLRNRTKGNRAITDDKVPTPYQLKRIIEHGDIKNRSFFLCLVSSGMRIGELCSIKLTDIDYNTTPTTISVRAEYTKSGNKRTAFISDEATEGVKAWLKHRDTYLKGAVQRSKIFDSYHNREPSKTLDDNRLYPFNTGTARDMWNRLLRNAGFDQKDSTTKIHKMHPHVLRKFFRSHMSLDIPLDVVEALMGHEGYLTEAYRRYSMDQLREMYLKGQHRITVFENAPELSDINQQLQEKDKQIIEMQKTLKEMKAQITELRLEKLERINGIKETK